MKNFVIVFRCLKREIDSVNAIGSKEVGGVSGESNVMNSDEHTEEFQNVFDSISVVEFARTEKDGDRFRESVGCVS